MNLRLFKNSILTLALCLGLSSSLVRAEENWKGPHLKHNGSFGAILGLGVLDGTAGFTVQGQASFMLLDKGFFPDLTNQVHLELSLGPNLGITGTTPIQYSLHLRWDFRYNKYWTFFAMGGLGGTFSPFRIHIRFGMGAFYRVSDAVWLRAEASHETIGFGVTVPF